MTNLDPAICRKLKEARREAGMSQSELAAAIGCKQSALSLFERGDGTKLSKEIIEKFAEHFKIDLKSISASRGDKEAGSQITAEMLVEIHGFCPNAHCPSNHAYSVDGRVLALPDRKAADPVGGRYCALCGEVLEKRCPNCGAPVHEGAICSICGEPYVTLGRIA